MFEREVKFIYDFNSTKVKKLGSTATYMELIPLKLHPAIMQYISAEIEYRVYEDRQTLLKHSMFDYTGREIAKHFQGIADEIKKEKRFSTEFISKVILHATSFNINHLIRPNWSLKKLIFDTSESSPIEEINQILNYAYFYKHVPNVLREYFEKKKLITMDKNQFGELLERVDGASFEQYGKDLLDSAVKSMASFFNIGSMNQSKVPLQAIGIYLTEKHLTEHMAKLEKDLEGETKSKIELTDLRNILFDVPIETTETYEAPEPEGEQLELEEEEIITESPVQTESEDLTVEESTEEIGIDEEIKESPEPEEEIEETPKPTKSDADAIEEEKEFDEDVEIKLRANKEKEVFEKEPEPEEEIETYEEEIETYEEESEEIILEDELNPDDDNEEILKEQELKNDEAAEHLVQETEKKSEIILTPEEEETFEEDDESDLSAASESEDERKSVTAELEEPETDTFDEIILEDETEQLEIVENEDETYLEEQPETEVEENEDFQSDEEPKLEEEKKEIDSEEVETETSEDEYEYDFESFDDYSYPEPELESKDEKDTPESEMVDEEEQKEDAVSEDDEVDQSTLFGDLPEDNEDTLNEISDPEEKEDFIRDYAEPKHAKKIDIADLLENKNMTKIIAVVFDYDMEEFANAIERICESSTSNEAFTTLSEIFELNDVNPSSKEAEAFKEIIAEYFEQN